MLTQISLTVFCFLYLITEIFARINLIIGAFEFAAQERVDFSHGRLWRSFLTLIFLSILIYPFFEEKVKGICLNENEFSLVLKLDLLFDFFQYLITAGLLILGILLLGKWLYYTVFDLPEAKRAKEQIFRTFVTFLCFIVPLGLKFPYLPVFEGW